MATARTFVCVWPDEPVVEQLRLLQRKDQPGVRFVPDENWHITLRFVGAADPAELAAAVDGVEVEPAAVTVGPVVELLGDHSVVVRVDGLAGWAAAVARATGHLGDAPLRKRFVGHITLARLSGRARRAARSLPDVVGVPVAATFTATELAVVVSHLHPDGARYDTYATVPASGT